MIDVNLDAYLIWACHNSPKLTLQSVTIIVI